jgi:hypothetical protein
MALSLSHGLVIPRNKRCYKTNTKNQQTTPGLHNTMYTGNKTRSHSNRLKPDALGNRFCNKDASLAVVVHDWELICKAGFEVSQSHMGLYDDACHVMHKYAADA